MKLTVDGADFTKAEVLRDMTKLSLETVTQSIAVRAREFADMLDTGPPIDGATALRAFAEAILNTNAKVWPRKG